jgi:transcriptional regulator with XRE-family HTH domain
MNKLREIVRLHEVARMSQRQIARALNVSRPVVADTLTKIARHNLNYRDIESLSDSQLEIQLAAAPPITRGKADLLRELFPYIARELKRPGVTRQLLWQEYLGKQPTG